MKRLIINADDFGLTHGVTRGILDAHLNGIVTSTSTMMNSPHAAESLNTAHRAAPNLGMGVHLVLTWGKPLLAPDKVPSLVDDTGQFFRISQLSGLVHNYDPIELRNEWQAQIEAFLASGLQPDHLDSHHHSSYLDMKLFMVMLELAQKYSLPIRFPPALKSASQTLDPYLQNMEQHAIHHPQSCITGFYGEGVSPANFARIISELPHGISELMCHPGFADSELIEGSSYAAARETELRILTGKDIKKKIEENGVSLSRFSDL